MDKRTCQASGCDALNTITKEAKCNLQMFAPIMKQETVQCLDDEESNRDNHMCGNKSLKSPNCVNYYDGQFRVSIEVKEEFPEGESPQSSTAASCINKSTIDSNIVFENEELSKVLETQEIKQEVSEEAFSFIKTEEIHDKKDKFIVKIEMSEEYRILGNAGDTSVPYKGQTTHQEIQPKMCGGILKNGFNSLTHNNECIKIEPPTLVGIERKELHKCQYCDEYFNDNNMLAHMDNVHSDRNHKPELCDENIKKVHAGRNVDEINYKCDSCKRIYKSKCALDSHFKKVHYSYGRLFKCWCGKQFPTPIHLCQHKSRQHSVKVKRTDVAELKKEFQCDVCKKILKSKRGLTIHITSFHYDYGKTFECWCGKQFRTPWYLKVHQKDRSRCFSNNRNKYKHKCEHCRLAFKMKRYLVRHVKRKHKQLT